MGETVAYDKETVQKRQTGKCCSMVNGFSDFLRTTVVGIDEVVSRHLESIQTVSFS
jgi:2-phosphoglycerate kinase